MEMSGQLNENTHSTAIASMLFDLPVEIAETLCVRQFLASQRRPEVPVMRTDRLYNGAKGGCWEADLFSWYVTVIYTYDFYYS